MEGYIVGNISQIIHSFGAIFLLPDLMHSWYKIIIGIALSTVEFENQGDCLTKREPFTKMLI